MGCGTSKTLDVNSDVRDTTKLKQVHNPEDGGRGLKAWNELSDAGQEDGCYVHLTNLDDKTAGDISHQCQKSFAIGDTVHVRGYIGVIKFVGSTELGEGDWIGIKMNQEHMSREKTDLMNEFSIFFAEKNEASLRGREWCFTVSHHKKRRTFSVLFHLRLLCLHKLVCDVFCLPFEGEGSSFVPMSTKL